MRDYAMLLLCKTDNQLLKDIWPEFLAAFLGFLSALLVAELLDKFKKKKAIINIGMELVDVEEQLGKVINDDNLPPVLAYSLYFPIWNSLLYTGQIFDLRNEKYYLSLLSLYAHLEKLKLKEEWLYENYRSLKPSEIKNEMDSIVGLRSKVCNLFKDELICEVKQKAER